MSLLSRRLLGGSSHAWIQRQIHDTFVKQAQEQNFRNRAAFKLLQIDDKFSIFRKNSVVVDLGCYSGGWSQVALQRSSAVGAFVVGVDVLKIEPLPSPHVFVQGDITNSEIRKKVIDQLKGKKADVVLSDMAPSSCGVAIDDHIKITDLNLKACEFMEDVIALKGSFVMKTFYGPETKRLTSYLKSRFERVIGHKPAASRKESRELFLVCSKYKARDKIATEVSDTFRISKEGENRLPAENSQREPQSVQGLNITKKP